jgi:hypothetical protein
MTTKIIKLRHAVIAALLPWLAPPANAQDVEAPVDAPLVVQDVTCTGNLATSCDFIRDHLYLEAGQRSTRKRLQRGVGCRHCAISNRWRFAWKRRPASAVIVVIEVEGSPITTEWLLGGSTDRIATRRVGGRIGIRISLAKGKLRT